jgi:hypothetical protein
VTATTTLPVLFATGIHASRPSASAVGAGGLYSCTTHNLVYQTDGVSTWSTWATLGSAASGSITASGYTQSTAKMLGRSTASTGAIEEITVGTGLSLSAGSLTATGSAGAMTLITDTLLGGDTASFDFTSIAGTYKHLEIIFQGRSINGGSDTDFITIRFNNDSGSNYHGFWMQLFNGFTTASGNEDTGATSFAHAILVPGATSTAGAVASGKIVIPDYASTTFHKSFSFQGFDAKAESTTNLRVQASGGVWASTAAITRVTLAGTGSWKTGSRASLYGIS